MPSGGENQSGGCPPIPGERTGTDGTSPAVSIVVSRFPKFTETFVFNEIVALERQGLRIEIHPLLSPEAPPHQPLGADLVGRARFGRPWGWHALRALVRTMWSSPRIVAGITARLVRDTWRHPEFLVKDLALLPRICAVADDVRRLGVRHVRAHFVTHAGFAAWAVHRLTGVPYSLVGHGSDIYRNRSMLCTKLGEAAFTTTVSEYIRDVVVSECGSDAADNVSVVHCGVDIAGIEVDPPRPMPDVPCLVCVGRLIPVKGHHHLVDAVRLLGDRGRRVRLVVVGEGEARRSLEERIASSGMTDYVHLAGGLAHHEVIDSYRAADIVVVPSVASSDGRQEGIPTVIMEAIAVGRPVIASDLAGIPELIIHERTGLLVPPGDVVGLADAIERLISEPDLGPALARAGRDLVEREYALDRNAARIADLIRQAC